ncbi:MAG: hypothetical protein RI894_1327 [Bacteroidota bacterium]|jgi:hypothetical protein
MAARKQSFPLLEPNLADRFGLIRLRPPSPILTDWLSATGNIIPEDMRLLDKVLIKIIDNADSWNEEELKMQFISIIILLADIDPRIRTYYDREINETIDGEFLSCKSDMMLSKGIGELIKTPYFFMHEYKREKKYSGDPIGQMLGGMLIAQAKNAHNMPIYGCYIQGRHWYFSVLIGKEYVISNDFNSSTMPEVQQIIFILRKLNTIILEQLMV